MAVQESETRLQAADPGRTRPDPRSIAFAAVLALGVLLGLLLRIHLLTHVPIDGDEAVAGLMAEQIRRGHFYTFFWGQQYGGGEGYVTAALFAVFGMGPAVLDATATVLTAASAILLWRSALRLVPPRRGWLAALAAVLFWVWPEAALWNSTREFGFRPLTMVAGLAALLAALRLVERWRWADAALLGLAMGVGWWSSPEIVYFAVAVVFVLGPAMTADRARRTGLKLVVAGAAFLLGALPWVWTNFHTGFASLRLSSAPTYIPTTYAQRLSIFFHRSLPMMLDLRRPLTGAWVGGRGGQLLYGGAVLVIGAATARAVAMGVTSRRGAHLRDRPRNAWAGTACAAALIAFPLVYALFPATSYWQDGHYAVFVVPLLLLVLVSATPHPRSIPAAAPVAVGLASVTAVALTLNSFAGQFLPRAGAAGFMRAGPAPDAQAIAAVHGLEAAGIRYSYADYWVAYDLDFLSHDRLAVTDPSVDRWTSLYRRVRHSTDPAWIFYDPARVSEDVAEFRSTDPGPFGFPEKTFLDRLGPLAVTYRILHFGALDVVVTSRPVLQEQVGMAGPMFH